jgi:TolB-like protein
VKSYKEFFAELKRRKVFRVAGIYGIVSFGVLQAADLMLPRLGVPDWTVTFMVALVFLAFPVALILAWAFEVTPDGVRRTGDAEIGEIEGIIAQPASKRWPAGLLGLVGVAALVAGAWWVGRTTAPGDDVTAPGSAEARLAFAPGDDDRPSIAVLPFVNMSSDEEQEYFSDGMTEEILNSLANIDQLRVAGRTSAFAYKDRTIDLREIGNQLGVRYLLEGSVRKAGDQLRITAQLIEATDGSHLWSHQYDRQLEDVFAIQTEIATAIADALTVPLGLEANEQLVTPTGDLAAYDLYLAGRAKLRQRGWEVLEAIRFFEAAVARDSAWAPAWAALAEAREIRVWYLPTFDLEGGEPLEDQVAGSLRASEVAARRALDLDPENASALVALGSVHRDRGEWEAAEATYQQALSLDPDNAEAHQQYAELHSMQGRVAEAVREADRAVLLDPAPIRFAILGTALILDDRFHEAADVFRILIDRYPDDARGVLQGSAIFARVGRIDEAVEETRKAYRMSAERPAPWWPTPADGIPPDSVIAEWARAIAEARPWDVPEDLRHRIGTPNWAAAGEVDSAVANMLDSDFQWVNVGLPWHPGLWEPALDSLRSHHPRVRAYMERLGIGDASIQRTPPGEQTRPMILQASEATQ